MLEMLHLALSPLPETPIATIREPMHSQALCLVTHNTIPMNAFDIIKFEIFSRPELFAVRPTMNNERNKYQSFIVYVTRVINTSRL